MKKGFMLFTLLAAFSGFAQADDAAIQQTLAKMGIKSSDIQPAPVAGMKTVLTNSGVLYITDDGKHIIQGPMYDVSGTAPVNVTNKMLLKQLNALEKEMIHRIPFGYFVIRRNRRKSGIDRRTGKGGVAA